MGHQIITFFKASMMSKCHLNKKVTSDFEDEYDDLQQEHRRLMSQSDALSLELRKLEKEEMHGR